MANRFKDKILRIAYDKFIEAYDEKSPVLFREGHRYTGMSLPRYFWNGFDGVKINWDRNSRQWVVYAAYRAGQDAAKA